MRTIREKRFAVACSRLFVPVVIVSLWAATSSYASRNDEINMGASPSKAAELQALQRLTLVPASELHARRETLKEYFTHRRGRLNVVATTVTDRGQVIDWIPRASQSANRLIASPPPLDATQLWTEHGEQLARFELADQPQAQGPAGTVPVLRRDLDIVLDNIDPPPHLQDFLSKYGNARASGGPELRSNSQYADPGNPAHEYVYTAQYVENFGGHGNINVWNPYVYKAGEFSLGQVAVVRENGGGAKQTIEAGWQDYKNLYGDSSPHFFIYYTTNGYASQGDNVGGYNQDVDGWVQYSSTVFPGALITWTSTYGSTQYSMHIRVQLYAGNWWLRMNDEWVGYYPASLFATNGLRDKADKISWYGEVVDLDDGVTTYTDMGSGQFASANWQKAAYMRNIWHYDINTGYRYEYNPDTVWESKPDCYTIEDHFLSETTWESYFWFGGPGKSASCP